MESRCVICMHAGFFSFPFFFPKQKRWGVIATPGESRRGVNCGTVLAASTVGVSLRVVVSEMVAEKSVKAPWGWLLWMAAQWGEASVISPQGPSSRDLARKFSWQDGSSRHTGWLITTNKGNICWRLLQSQIWILRHRDAKKLIQMSNRAGTWTHKHPAGFT